MNGQNKEKDPFKLTNTFIFSIIIYKYMFEKKTFFTKSQAYILSQVTRGGLSY